VETYCRKIVVVGLALVCGCAATVPTELTVARDDLAARHAGEQEARLAMERRWSERGYIVPALDPAVIHERSRHLVYARPDEPTMAQQIAEQVAIYEAERRLSVQDRRILEYSREMDRMEAGQAGSAEAGPAPATYSQTTAGGDVYFVPGDVGFRTDEWVLRPEAARQLDRLAATLAATPDRLVVVEGHTDSRGSVAHNLDLSRRRAETVRSYLISQGCAAGNLMASGIGDERPVGDNRTREGRAANRRVEIVVEPSRKP
jgi:outer membrane protein OmpA-like peptidoglycan-associated protein